MKKYILFLILIVLLKIIFPIESYVECNHLSIITKIVVRCDSAYDITYYETIPVREDNGLKYHYKKYHVQDQNLIHGIHLIENNKHIYKDKSKILVYCSHKKKIIQTIKET